MKAKVLIPFNDKYTGKTHEKGEILDVSAERFNEINKKDRLVEAYEVPATATTQKA